MAMGRRPFPWLCPLRLHATHHCVCKTDLTMRPQLTAPVPAQARLLSVSQLQTPGLAPPWARPAAILPYHREEAPLGLGAAATQPLPLLAGAVLHGGRGTKQQRK